MKTIFLSLFLVLLATTINAQWNIGLHAGLCKAFYKPFEDLQGTKDSGTVTSLPSFISSVYILSAKDWPVNLGIGLGVRQNNIDIYREREGYKSGVNIIDLRHKSTYLSVSPMVDVRLVRKGFLHVLVGPNINVLIVGKENGYNLYSTGSRDQYQNSSKNIKQICLGIQGQLQGRYPVARTLEATGTLGYSINNTISSRLPRETSNASFQLGVIYKFSMLKTRKDNKEKARAEEE